MDKIFDCDIHQTYSHQAELYPYLEEPYLTRIKKSGLGYPPSPYISPIGYKRPEAKPEEGTAGSDLNFLAGQIFGDFGIDKAVLNGHGIFSVSYILETDFPVALARAYNLWMIEEWLNKDNRLYGSLHIAMQNPPETAKMIRELGGHPQVIQVIVPSQTTLPITHKFYDPILRAISDMDLVLAFHTWQPSVMTPPATPLGNPTSYIEWRTLAGFPSIAQMVTAVMSGLFIEYPNLKCLFLEGGFSWLPYHLWRMDQLYKSFRSEVPWLKMMPSEYITKHCTFGTQPIEEPTDNNHLSEIIDMIHGNKSLVYASDYPHWDADEPKFAAKHIPNEYHEDIFYNNAMALYGLE